MAFEKKEEKWNICPEHWASNFNCTLTNTGIWRLEPYQPRGKWLFLMKPKTNFNFCPTFRDQRNFLIGLLEADRRNDEYRKTNFLKNGKLAKSQIFEDIRKFRECIDEFENSIKKGEQKKLCHYGKE